METIVIKTITGDEIIAKLTNETQEEIFVSRPRVLQITPANTPTGYTAGLVPYFMTNPDIREVGINRSAIVAYFQAPMDIEKSYSQAISGIQLS